MSSLETLQNDIVKLQNEIELYSKEIERGNRYIQYEQKQKEDVKIDTMSDYNVETCVLISNLMNEIALLRTQLKQQNPDENEQKVFVMPYKKAVVIYGNTKPYKEELKTMNGHFNKFLKNPQTNVQFAGWIFRKEREEELKAWCESKN